MKDVIWVIIVKGGFHLKINEEYIGLAFEDIKLFQNGFHAFIFMETPDEIVTLMPGSTNQIY